MNIPFFSRIGKPAARKVTTETSPAMPPVAVAVPVPAQRTAAPVRSLSTAVNAAPPAPPEIREIESLFSRLAYRIGETLAKTPLYFPAADLALLGMPTDSADLAEEASCMARRILLRAEIRHGERYVTYGAELDGAIRAAAHAAHLFRLLAENDAYAAALPVLRRVTDAADRVIVRSAKLLDAPVCEAYERGGLIVAAQNELATACFKAGALLRRQPALLPEHAERMARAAVWSVQIAAETAAHVSLEARGLVLPATAKPALPPLDGLQELPIPHKQTRQLQQPLTRPVPA